MFVKVMKDITTTDEFEAALQRLRTEDVSEDNDTSDSVLDGKSEFPGIQLRF